MFYKVHAFIVERNEYAAILLMKAGGVSSQTLMRLSHFFCRIVVETQRKRYRFLIKPQPTVAMLHRRQLREGGCLMGGWAMRLLDRCTR